MYLELAVLVKGGSLNAVRKGKFSVQLSPYLIVEPSYFIIIKLQGVNDTQGKALY